MAAERQIPGGIFVNETGTAQRQVPGGIYVNETVAAAGGPITATSNVTLGALTNTSDTDVVVSFSRTTATFLGGLFISPGDSAAKVLISASSSVTLDALTISSSATISQPAGARTATLNVTLDPATIVAAGDVDVSASANQALGAVTITTAAAVRISATANNTLGAATLAGTGTISQPVGVWTLNVTLDALTNSSDADVLIAVSANQALDPASLAATGTIPVFGGPISASLNVALGALSLASAVDVVTSFSRTTQTFLGGLFIKPGDSAATISQPVAGRRYGYVEVTLGAATLAGIATIAQPDTGPRTATLSERCGALTLTGAVDVVTSFSRTTQTFLGGLFIKPGDSFATISQPDGLTRTATLIQVLGAATCASNVDVIVSGKPLGKSGRRHNAGHWLTYTTGNSTLTARNNAINAVNAAAPGALRGVQMRYKWRDLEVAQDDYSGLDVIATDLAWAKSRGLQFMPMLEDKTFRTVDGLPFPDYLKTIAFPVQTAIGTGYTMARWDPVYTTRFKLLMTAIGNRFDSDPNFEGMSIQETALGTPDLPNTLTKASTALWPPPPASSNPAPLPATPFPFYPNGWSYVPYTPIKYRDALIEQIQHCGIAMPSCRLFWHFNFMPTNGSGGADGSNSGDANDGTYFNDVANACRENICMGGPDALIERGGLWSRCYPWYVVQKDLIPMFIDYQQDSYQESSQPADPSGGESQQGAPWHSLEDEYQHSVGIWKGGCWNGTARAAPYHDGIFVNYQFWTVILPASTPTGANKFDPDAVNTIAAHPTFNEEPWGAGTQTSGPILLGATTLAGTVVHVAAVRTATLTQTLGAATLAGTASVRPVSGNYQLGVLLGAATLAGQGDVDIRLVGATTLGECTADGTLTRGGFFGVLDVALYEMDLKASAQVGLLYAIRATVGPVTLNGLIDTGARPGSPNGGLIYLEDYAAGVITLTYSDYTSVGMTELNDEVELW